MGKFKDALHGVPIVEFVGLRSKMYSTSDNTGKEKERAKWVKRGVVSRDINHKLYKLLLLDNGSIRHHMNFILCDGASINTATVNNTSLSAFDDKRYILNDAVSSYAFGHYKIND